jgi:hypothetical protein
VPTRKFIEAKSGYCIGTGVGATDTVVCAAETTGAVESTAKSAHPSAVKTEGFMPFCPFFHNAPTKRVPKLVLFELSRQEDAPFLPEGRREAVAVRHSRFTEKIGRVGLPRAPA